jgi:hypothetical protein
MVVITLLQHDILRMQEHKDGLQANESSTCLIQFNSMTDRAHYNIASYSASIRCPSLYRVPTVAPWEVYN